MSQPQRNRLNQVLFVMVDAVDMVTIRSALTNPPTGKTFGVKHGVSDAAASRAISKTISHVRSGIYRATIKPAENDFDYGLLRFVQPSCADQIIPWVLVQHSQIASAVWEHPMGTRIDSVLSRLDSDIQSRFPATIPELTSDPGATPTWAQAEMLQFMWLRNNSKTTTSKRFLRNNAGTTVLSATMAETANTSFTQGKLG